MANVHFTTFQTEAIMARMAEDHANMLEKKLEQVLNDHGIALDQPGIALKVQQNGLQFVYTVENMVTGQTLSTFGFELDLTGIKDYSNVNDLDIAKLLAVK